MVLNKAALLFNPDYILTGTAQGPAPQDALCNMQGLQAALPLAVP